MDFVCEKYPVTDLSTTIVIIHAIGLSIQESDRTEICVNPVVYGIIMLSILQTGICHE